MVWRMEVGRCVWRVVENGDGCKGLEKRCKKGWRKGETEVVRVVRKAQE